MVWISLIRNLLQSVIDRIQRSSAINRIRERARFTIIYAFQAFYHVHQVDLDGEWTPQAC